MMPLLIKAITPPKKNTPLGTGKDAEAGTKDRKPDMVVKPPDMSHFHDLLGLLASHKADSNFGPESVEAGHHVAFKAGDFSGSGKVSSTGRDGLCVTDSSKREHRVHWREVTGHFAPEKEEKKQHTPKTKLKKATNDK